VRSNRDAGTLGRSGAVNILEARMNALLKSAVGAAGFALAAHAMAEITLFEREDFRGRSFTTERQVGNLERFGFNNRASSAIVERGRWEVCDGRRFEGRCVMLRPGRYDSLRAMGLGDAVTSVRELPRGARYEGHYEGDGPRHVSSGYDYRRRNGERLYQADVTSVRAVVGPPEQHCWVEREQFVRQGGDVNVPGAIAGAVIGGILGHQIGGGRGQDIATAAGAVGGAALGANVGAGGPVYGQDVQRCSSVPSSARPEYWDVTYRFRGMDGRVQMTYPPGPTIAVNRQGEPRV
jgi:uncharacterized protein YcfJ